MSGVSMGKHWWQSLAIASASVVTLYANRSVAQITPDGTLPNNSNVRLEGNTRIISGGTTRGANLFHSFEEFSIPNGSNAFFDNALDIQNILTRVTGKSISNIDGLISAKGTANLFLINPNGIIFGTNAKLDIGGSFVASTASSLKFRDGFEFSATTTQSTPLLTISVPIGLQYTNPGPIEVQKSVLQVKPDRTLALVGGNINIEGGFLEAKGGRISLGGLTSTGMLDIEGQQSVGVFKLTDLRFPDRLDRADIFLNNNANLNVSSSGGGSIAINARNLTISSSRRPSRILAGITEGKGEQSAKAGDIALDATGKITIADRSIVSNNVEERAIGNAGNIKITARSLDVTDGSQILARNNGGRGNAGSVTINASDTIYVETFKGNGDATIASDVWNGGVGNGNNVNITAGTVVLDNDAVIAASIINGKGEDGKFAQAGNVNVIASDRVLLKNRGRMYSEVGSNSVGYGGTINITAPLVSLDNAYLITRIKEGGQGRAGGINIIAFPSLVRYNNNSG